MTIEKVEVEPEIYAANWFTAMGSTPESAVKALNKQLTQFDLVD